MIDPARQQHQQPDWFSKEGLALDDLDASGNPLLGSMGKLGRDYFHQLHGLNAVEIDAFVDGKENSLLHCLQCDILELNDRTAPGSAKTAGAADEIYLRAQLPQSAPGSGSAP